MPQRPPPTHDHAPNRYPVYTLSGHVPCAIAGHLTLLAPRVADEMSYWVGSVPSLDDLAAQYGADRQVPSLRGRACPAPYLPQPKFA
jgi:hypothetical protein